jgi:uncharacterized membrane protein YedE/YeeE
LVEPRRYFPAVAIGGAVAGVAMSIPMLGDLLRSLLCVGVMAGALLAMKLWLDTHPAENLSFVDAAVLGAVEGAVAAGANWLLSVPIRIAFGEGLARFYEGATWIPDLARQNLISGYAASGAAVLVSLPLGIALYAMMGAVGGALSLQLVFASRRDE